MTAKDPFSQFFDPDVSVRIQGDRQDALGLMPQAQHLLRRATLFREAGQPVVKMWSELPDGSLLWAYLHGPVKQLYIRPGTKRVTVDEGAQEEVVVGVDVFYVMLSGVVRPGTMLDIVSSDGTITEVAHEFHPTQVCANVYDLKYEYQDMAKLGVENPQGTDLQSHYPKPSMYSGAMKRVVQALYGIGRAGADGMSEDVSGGGEVTVQNFYRCEWECTHGIFRDVHGVWLIEISKERGVLKMKLPIFEGTEADTYLDFLVNIEDSDTAGIVSEFGGLPNGETFPENDLTQVPPVMALDEAIEAGDVIRLAKPEDIAEFYKDSATQISKLALWGNCCWAFSDSGVAATIHNTCFWYSNEAFATVLNTARADAVNHSPMRYELLEYDGNFPLSTVAPLTDRAMRAEHWKIGLEGSGATLSAVEKGLLAGPQKTVFILLQPDVYVYSLEEMLRVPSSNDDRLYLFLYWGRPPSRKPLSGSEQAQYLSLDCPMMVFYKGESLEVVRHQYEQTYTNGYVNGTVYEDPEQTAYGPPSGPDSWSYTNNWGTQEFSNLVEGQNGVEITLGGTHYDSLVQYDVLSTVHYETGFSAGWVYWAWKMVDLTHIITSSQMEWNGSMWVEAVRYYQTIDRRIYIEDGPQWGEDFGVGHANINPDGSAVPPVLMFDVEGNLYDITASSPAWSSKDIWADNPFAGGTAFYPAGLSYPRRWSGTWRRAGAFYSTSHDLRRNEAWGCIHNGSYYNFTILRSASNWEQEIGLVIPAFVREGCLFVEWQGGRDKTTQTTWDAFFGHDGEQLTEQVVQSLFVPGLGPGIVSGPVLHPTDNPQWVKFVNALKFVYAGSINAGPTDCGVAQDGIYADTIFGSYPGEVLTPPASFLGTANGIPVDDCIAKDTTFVGAV